MTQSMRVRLLLGSALLIVPLQAHSQDQMPAQAPLPLAPRKPVTVAAVQPAAAVRRATPHQPVTVGAVRPAAGKRLKLVRHAAAPAPQPAPVAMTVAPAAPPPKPSGLVAAVTLADIGFINGLHFANLGGHRELFVPLPQGADVTATTLTLVIDDFSAHEAKRNLEVQLNDRTVAAIALDGQGRGRAVQCRSARREAEGRLSQTLVSLFRRGHAGSLHRRALCRRQPDGAAGDRGRYRDRLSAGRLDVATTAALMPRDVAVVLPTPARWPRPRSRPPSRWRARSISSGRRVSFHHGLRGAGRHSPSGTTPGTGRAASS